MRSKSRRPGRCRASFAPKKKRGLKAVATILILCIIAVPLLYASSVAEQPQEQEQSQEAEPINITVPQPLKLGRSQYMPRGRLSINMAEKSPSGMTERTERRLKLLWSIRINGNGHAAVLRRNKA